MRQSMCRRTIRNVAIAILALFPLIPHVLFAWPLHKPKPHARAKEDSLDAYLDRARQWTTAPAYTMGSLWQADGRMADLASDDKARRRGDAITIQIAESTTSALQGSVQTQRTYAASSGVSAFFGLPVASSPLGNMFSPNSSQALAGKGQTALSSTLNTTLAANVAEVLPDGGLVIEATRDVEVSDQHQTMILRGIVRREDVSANDVVLSTAISHLEVELRGKGVVTEGTHPPNSVVRLLLRVVGF